MSATAVLSPGIRCDPGDDIRTAARRIGDGHDRVHVLNPTGDKIGPIRLLEICAKVCSGGPKRNRPSWPPASPSTSST